MPVAVFEEIKNKAQESPEPESPEPEQESPEPEQESPEQESPEQEPKNPGQYQQIVNEGEEDLEGGGYKKLFRKIIGKNKKHQEEADKVGLRLPGYADRVLYKTDDKLEPILYTSLGIKGNDHLPIYKIFKIKNIKYKKDPTQKSINERQKKINKYNIEIINYTNDFKLLTNDINNHLNDIKITYKLVKGSGSFGQKKLEFVSNPDNKNTQLGKAGRNRWLGKRPSVRGVAMNPVDHPHGGGEGRTSGGRHPSTPWGFSTKGRKTRKNKRTQKYIISRSKKRTRK